MFFGKSNKLDILTRLLTTPSNQGFLGMLASSSQKPSIFSYLHCMLKRM
jgi:hypothetical protein